MLLVMLQHMLMHAVAVSHVTLLSCACFNCDLNHICCSRLPTTTTTTLRYRSCTLSLPLEDAEPLIKEGVVEQLHWDDVGRYA